MGAKLGPYDTEPLIRLGSLLEDKKDYDAALTESRAAEELDENSFKAHRSVGTVLLTRKDAAGALEEVKMAEDLDPRQSHSHDPYPQALLLTGDLNAAVSAFKETLAL